MTKVFFYHGVSNRLQFAIHRLIIPCYRQNKPVTIYTASEGDAEKLDEMLWLEEGFIPHCRINSPLAVDSPILIGTDLDGSAIDQRLINLSDRIPPGFGRFLNLIEIIEASEEEIQSGRLRYKHYRDRGYELQSFKAS